MVEVQAGGRLLVTGQVDDRRKNTCDYVRDVVERLLLDAAQRRVTALAVLVETTTDGCKWLLKGRVKARISRCRVSESTLRR